MRQLFPSQSARKGNLLKDLKNDEKKKGMVYYCEQCGMPCNTNKVTSLKKEEADGGADTVTITTATYTPSGGSAYYYPDTVQPKAKWCPFCGTSRSKTK